MKSATKLLFKMSFKKKKYKVITWNTTWVLKFKSIVQEMYLKMTQISCGVFAFWLQLVRQTILLLKQLLVLKGEKRC